MNRENWYCIKFDIPKNMNAIEFSKNMNEFLGSIDEFNKSIIHGIYDTFTVASYIEDFETGSIKWWLCDKLQKIDDKAIDKFVDNPLKTTIASILKFSKKKALETLNKNDIETNQKKTEINTEILKYIESKKEELQQDNLGLNIEINIEKLLVSLSNMSQITKNINSNVEYIEDYNNQWKSLTFPSNFSYKEKEENNEIMKQEIEAILLIKKPVYIGSAKWELIFDKTINAEMKDIDFLNKFQQGNIKNLYPSCKIKCNLLIEVELDNQKNPIETKHTILKILEIIEPKNNQQNLFDRDN